MHAEASLHPNLMGRRPTLGIPTIPTSGRRVKSRQRCLMSTTWPERCGQLPDDGPSRTGQPG